MPKRRQCSIPCFSGTLCRLETEKATLDAGHRRPGENSECLTSLRGGISGVGGHILQGLQEIFALPRPSARIHIWVGTLTHRARSSRFNPLVEGVGGGGGGCPRFFLVCLGLREGLGLLFSWAASIISRSAAIPLAGPSCCTKGIVHGHLRCPCCACEYKPLTSVPTVTTPD